MEALLRLLHRLYDVRALIQWGGLSLVGAVVFTETGLFMGFFLPGDSLLVTAGVFARAGELRLGWLLLLGSACAVAGDQLGYAIGARAGQALYQRPDSWCFKKAHLKRTHQFFERYGAKTIVLARFVPIVRTFAPVVAGVGEMRYRRFLAYNVLGGVGWVCATALAGYGLASLIPNVESRIHEVILVVIVLSLLPAAFEFWRARRRALAG
ncbi:MAG: VTT domain-containing protein [Elusimicrobia bacterium]|nr:VTT domain-containing protein [Elusimicrobiota bacterium]MDE2426026.1 VTT domain-containing protein [Elusimicrobiota bacterium]